MKKRLFSLLLIFIFAVSVLPLSLAEATDTITGRTAYDQIIKSGKTVYCSTYAGLYKVTLKNGKPKEVKRLAKYKALGMIKVGKYIYYLEGGTSAGGTVYRVNVTNGKKKRLTGYLDEGDFTIAGNTLYYSRLAIYDFDDDEEYYEDYEDYDDEDDYYTDPEYETFAANLDGSSPVQVDVTIKSKTKRSNVRNYRTSSKTKGKYIYGYLKTPKGKFYLGRTKAPVY